MQILQCMQSLPQMLANEDGATAQKFGATAKQLEECSRILRGIL